MSEAVSRAPRPGEPGYIPPARCCQPAGLALGPEHYDYNPGRPSTNFGGGAETAVPRAHITGQGLDILAKRPEQLTQAEAQAVLDRARGLLMQWIEACPHDIQGPSAVLVTLFRDLAARDLARAHAAQHGRAEAPDAIDQAVATPAPAFFALRQFAEQVGAVLRLVEGYLITPGRDLDGATRAMLDQVAAEAARLVV